MGTTQPTCLRVCPVYFMYIHIYYYTHKPNIMLMVGATLWYNVYFAFAASSVVRCQESCNAQAPVHGQTVGRNLGCPPLCGLFQESRAFITVSTYTCLCIHTYIHTYIHVYYVVLSIHVLSIPCPEYLCGCLIITPQHVACVSDGHVVKIYMYMIVHLIAKFSIR